MTLFSKLFGGAKKTPEELATLQEAGAALEALRHERADARTALEALVEKRRAALLADESDKNIQALDAEHDRLLLLQERLDAAEPRILARIGELQGKQRRELFESMVVTVREREAELDTALAAAVLAFDSYQVIAEQFDRAGFGQEARSVIIPPPMMGGGVLASAATIENWRRMREAHADRRAAFESRKANPTPKAQGPYKAPRFIPTPFTPSKPIVREIAPPPAPMSVKRVPRKLSGPVGPGYVRVRCVRNNVSFENTMAVVGDEFDVLREVSDHLARGVAFEIIALGEKIDEAAQ